MREPRDKTAEVKATSGRLQIARDDVCDAFEQDADRLFSNYECWYCKYGDFGIFTEHPRITGVCRLESSAIGQPDSDLYQNTEDKRI
jgi:hypothetical protein